MKPLLIPMSFYHPPELNSICKADLAISKGGLSKSESRTLPTFCRAEGQSPESFVLAKKFDELAKPLYRAAYKLLFSESQNNTPFPFFVTFSCLYWKALEDT